MAECPGQNGGEAEVKSQEKQEQKTPVDEELEELLDDALQDFDKQTQQKKVETLEEKAEQNVSASDSKHNVQGDTPCSTPNESSFAAILSEEELAKMAEEFTKAFESMPEDDLKLFQEFGKVAMGAAGGEGSGNPADIEANLTKAWNEMSQNLKDAQAQAGDGEMDAEFLNAMKSFSIVDQDGNAEGLIGMMQGMMKNLLSKDILYPSLKEIQKTYPSWLEENEEKIPDDEYKRYSKQYKLVCEICEEFEKEKDEDPDELKRERFEKIMEMMQRMQEFGQPPVDVLGQMDGDLGSTAEGATAAGNPEAANPEQCIVS